MIPVLYFKIIYFVFTYNPIFTFEIIIIITNMIIIIIIIIIIKGTSVCDKNDCLTIDTPVMGMAKLENRALLI